jgi:hypothetical protein
MKLAPSILIGAMLAHLCAVCGCRTASEDAEFADAARLAAEARAPVGDGVIVTVTGLRRGTKREALIGAMRDYGGVGGAEGLDDAERAADLMLSEKQVAFSGLPPSRAMILAEGLKLAGAFVALSGSPGRTNGLSQ